MVEIVSVMNMDASTSRGHRMVTLALNQQLRQRIKAASRKSQKTRATVCRDPDYRPPQGDISNQSFSSNENSNESNSCQSDFISTVDKGGSTEGESLYEFAICIVENIIGLAIDNVEMDLKTMYTKKGTIRKRRIFDTTTAERKKQKRSSIMSDHKIKKACNKNVCILKCSEKIKETRQTDINKQYWDLDKQSQRLFVHSCVKKLSKKKFTVGSVSRRSNTFKYYLKDCDGLEVQVCKTFFLATLGYDKNNDRFLKNIRGTDKNAIVPQHDKRGHRPAVNAIEKQPIIDHIMSFRPTISHYRREHAPNRLYLPSDISIVLMYNDYKAKNPHFQGSYEIYRQQVSKLNISFAQLGCEECFQCAAYKLHKTEANHADPTLEQNCAVCKDYLSHKAKYISGRTEYDRDAKSQEKISQLIVSADLQKVVMLPRAEMFKEVIFTGRLIVFNESFVPVGKRRIARPLGVLWHEEVSGRKKEDIISAFYAFFLKNRDKESITIWLDNCSGQNKNWCLFSFFIYIVNADEVNLKNLTVKYFERGHTFMSADHFHHQVEKSLKQTGTVWDFNDYIQCVQNATKNTTVVTLQINNFYDWKDVSSKYKLLKTTPRFYLKDLSVVTFSRGERTLKYKTSFDTEEEPKELNFLNANAFKNGITLPSPRIHHRGVSQKRKDVLITNLQPIIPSNRLKFWQDLTVGNASDEENEKEDF